MVKTSTTPERPRCPSCGEHGNRVLLESQDRLLSEGDRFQVVECSSCGLAFTFPRNVDFDRHYPSDCYYAYQETRDSRLERLRLWLITKVPYGPIARRTPGRLLDVGCGTGRLAAAFQRQGWSVAGVEPSPEGAAVAARRGMEVHSGVLDDAPWPESTFDAVILNHSLEHMVDPKRAIQQAHVLLKPDGLLGISVPNFGSWQRRLFRSAWFQLDLPRHLQHFEPRALQSLVERCGFATMQMRSTSMLAGLPGSLQYAAFGRRVLHGRVVRVPMLLVYPALAASDLAVQGDCLNLVAGKQGDLLDSKNAGSAGPARR